MWISQEEVLLQAHLPGLGGKATALLYSASGFWAAGILHHAVYLPTSKARAVIQREEEAEMKLTPSPPSLASRSIQKASFAQECLASLNTLSPSDMWDLQQQAQEEIWSLGEDKTPAVR